MNSSYLFKLPFTCPSQFPIFTRSIISVVFFGSDHYSLPHLHALEERQSQHKDIRLLFVVTTSDKTPVRYHCIQNKIDHVIWPRTLTNNSIIINAVSQRIDKLKSINSLDKPEKLLGVIVSFGRFLPSSLLSLFNYGCFNIHPSLLPRWKGSNPLLYTLLADDKVTGITLFRLNPMHTTFDSGSVLYQKSIRLPCNKNTMLTPNQLATYLMPHSINAMFEVILYPNLPYLVGVDQSVISAKFQLPITYTRKPQPHMGLINWQEQSAEDIIRYWHAFQGTCVNLFTELCLLNTVQEEKENNSLIANFRLSECPLLVPHVDHVSNNNNGQNNAEAADIYCPNYESKVMDYLNEASILLHQPHTSSLPPGSIVYLRSQKDVKHHLIPYTFIACKPNNSSPIITQINSVSWLAVKSFLVNWPNSSTKSRHLTAIDLYNGYFLKYIQSLSSTLPISVVNEGRHSQQLGVRYFGEFRSNSSSTSSLLSGNNNDGNTLIKPWNELTPTILPSDLQSSSDMSIIVKNVHS
ncbi:unnamed protein product [Schistosoma haematobium]|nr:unnamed protein product [Schistosoma haematobium]CAH8441649.1 unnamed protein product [Schistosoma haematobium]